MNMKLRKYTFLFLIMAFLGACTNLKSSPVYVEGNKAIDGYDPVAYFVVNKAVIGKENINYQHNGTTWYFNSEKNKMLFVDNPEKYIPQYGGYCAYAMSNGFIVSSDAEQFTIVEGKLYLNNNESIKETFQEKTDYYILNADKQWQKKLK